MEDPSQVCQRAETLLSGIYKIPIHLEVLEQFESSHTVLRCAVRAQGAVTPLPASVIVKQRSLAPSSNPHDFDQVQLFSNEWASLEFLTSLPKGARLGPQMYASDRAAGLVVLEDLGGSGASVASVALKTVQDVLYAADRPAAIAALLGMGKVLGQIQGMSFGREAEFAALQTRLGTSTPVCDATRDLRGDLEAFHACLDALGLETPANFDRALLDLEAGIHPGNPSPVFQAFVHNDAGPHNFVVTGSGVQPLDFEFAGCGHGLLDIVCARLAFPPAFRGRILPPEVVVQVEDAFRAELSQHTAVMNDDEAFSRARAQACVHWAFSKLAGFWEPYLRERMRQGAARDTRDGRAPERSTFSRQQNFTYLRLALASLEEANELPDLRRALALIVGRLVQIWPETPLLGQYPAFGGEPWQYPPPPSSPIFAGQK